MTALRRIGWLSRRTEWSTRSPGATGAEHGAIVHHQRRDHGQRRDDDRANFSTGSAALAAKAATARISAETKAKFDEISKLDLSV